MRISGFGPVRGFRKPPAGDGQGPPGDCGRLTPAAARLAQVESLLRGWTTRWDETRILNILRGCDGTELNLVLGGVDLHQLTNDVDDHVWGPKNKETLYQLLTEQRLDELSVDTRAALILSLQTGNTHRSDERAIRNLFLGTRGAELTRLKLKLDQTDDHRDLHQLLFHDLDHSRYKAEILDHIAAQAGPAEEFKLLSDIDDTFYCNWKDERFPKGTVYPGVRQYYKEMDAARPGQGDDLTFVTARPDDRIGQVKQKTKRSLKQKGLGQMVVLAGSVASLLSNERLAEKKFQRMGELKRLYPEFCQVFTGDSGQGDALCGLKLNEANWPIYKATLIHDVVQTSPEVKDNYRRQRVYFFDTYAGAAYEAHQQGLLSLEGMRRVAQAACDDFGQTAFLDEAQRQARLVELQADLERVNSLLPADQHVKMGALPPLSSLLLPEPPTLPPGG